MITQSLFGTLPDGQHVERFSLVNANGMQVDILTLGGIIQRWLTGCDGDDIVLGFDSLEDYLKDSAYIGAVVGRYSNRIAGGNLPLESTEHSLSVNLQGNTLHGGADGFSHRNWQAEVLDEADEPSIRLTLHSPDGDQGFPGNLDAAVIYTLTRDNTLRIVYEAEADKTTVFNPTQHSYFNLDGHDQGTTDDHMIQVLADHYTPAREDGIPTGEIKAVERTVFDLRQPVALSEVMHRGKNALRHTQGLDHNWCINAFDEQQHTPVEAARVTSPRSGRTLIVSTTMPGIQVYNANFLPQGLSGKSGSQYGPYRAVCLETQFYPDTPHHPHFPSATLPKGASFRSVTEYKLIEDK